MEEIHHTHKETAWGWVAVLQDWRRSRARRMQRANTTTGTVWRIETPAKPTC